MEFLGKWLGKSQTKSASIAKERLQLVLIHDRIKISPRVMDSMRDEIIAVISKYVDIDDEGISISITDRSQQQRLVADIPILKYKNQS